MSVPKSDVEAVVVDYGGVLTTPVKSTIEAWLRADGIVPETFSRTLKAWMSRTAPEGTPVHRLETGAISIAEFEELFAAELRTHDGSPVIAEGLLGRLFAGMRAEPAMYSLVEDLRAAGVKVALLSNSWGNTYPRERIDALFDAIVISGEVGLRKPNAPIYQLVLDQLAVPGGRTVFVDDAEPNIAGARAVGMHGALHVDPAATRAAITELLPNLAVPQENSVSH